PNRFLFAIHGVQLSVKTAYRFGSCVAPHSTPDRFSIRSNGRFRDENIRKKSRVARRALPHHATHCGAMVSNTRKCCSASGGVAPMILTVHVGTAEHWRCRGPGA